MANHAVRNVVSTLLRMFFVDDYLLTKLSVQKLLAKFDQLWTELDNEMGRVVRDGDHKGYQYEEMTGR